MWQRHKTKEPIRDPTPQCKNATATIGETAFIVRSEKNLGIPHNTVGRGKGYLVKEEVFLNAEAQTLQNKCPKIGQGSGNTMEGSQGSRTNTVNQGTQARGRAFVIGTEEARQDPRVITGFRPLIPLASESLDEVYSIELADGRELKAPHVLLNCTLSLADELFSIDLIPIELGSFDAVVGMDWLSQNRATIGCYEKTVRITTSDGRTLVIKGGETQQNLGIVFVYEGS
ncbi:hypothetical protein OSB04_un001404 [Centaurea solstitialis]|uniref:Reverse transcriptase domain-containing protein n=1 Tax=Centaurea solstitialis TaxID=347529 RepID=A0AA38S440_9ASTR|nr:hypothetical protein OSB04_un001404 [Centaurea solstitialis]